MPRLRGPERIPRATATDSGGRSRVRRGSRRRALLVAALLSWGADAPAAFRATVGEGGWPTVGGDAGHTRYSPLAQIDSGNVGELRLVWTHRHGDVRSGWPAPPHYGTAFEATPILVGRRLVFSTPTNRVLAIDAATGEELWSFDPGVSRTTLYANMMTSRGVAAWTDRDAKGICSSRIFATTLDARLVALDLETGRRCEGFGDRGEIDLRRDLSPLTDPADYNLTSPPTIIRDRVIVGSSVADLVRRVAPPGTVRAFDPRTGRLTWSFHTVPRDGEPGSETWEGSGRQSGGPANVWSMISADPARGLAFLPVSTAGPDFFGGDRLGANLFSDSVVALRAETGERVWHFQTVHHDLWDYDLPAAPVLVTIERDGVELDAVAQVTKTGLVFLLERETGKPIFPVEERPVPASDVPGERAHPTQPFPTRPPPLVSHRIVLDDRDAARLARCRSRLESLRNEGIFTPPSIDGSIVYPSTAGGANWSGAAFDPDSDTLFVPVNDFPMTIRLDPLPENNVDLDDGIVLGSAPRALWWLWRGRGTGLRYHMIRELFFDGGLPCNRPPWGSLVAVDLSAGTLRWSVPTGEGEDGTAGIRNFGHPLATGGGLVFHAGTTDARLRAHEATTGRVLASFPLPAGANGGILTYEIDGRQILVVAAGGHANLGSPLGDFLVAYALPGP